MTCKVLLEDVLEDCFQGATVKRYREKPVNQDTGEVTAFIVKNANLAGGELALIGEYEFTTLYTRKSLAKYDLREGDILLPSRYRNFHCVCVDAATLSSLKAGVDTPVIVIPSDNSLVLRPNPVSILSKYLATYLLSPSGRAAIGTIEAPVRGESKFAETFVGLNPRDVKKISIPLPSLKDQSEIVLEYCDRIIEFTKDHNDRIAQLEQQYAAEISKRIASFDRHFN